MVWHGRRQIGRWPSSVGIGFGQTAYDAEYDSQTQYRGSDCKTDVLTHDETSQWEAMDDLCRTSVSQFTQGFYYFDLCAPDAGPSLRAAISDPGMTGCSKSTALLSSCNACRGLMFAAALA
jgi:hypothetical protein